MLTDKHDPITRTRELSLAGLMGALGLLLPMGFHALGWGGKILLPMHLPIVVAGFLIGPATAASLGLVVPLLSALLTGMPPLAPPLAVLMALELAAKAGVISILYRSLGCPILLALLAGILVDWAVLALGVWLAAGLLAVKAAPMPYVWAAVMISLPGTALQLLTAPAAVLAIQRRLPRLRPGKQESVE